MLRNMTVKFTKKATILSIDEIAINNRTTISKVKNRIYKKYSHEELRDSVVGWVMQKEKTNLSSYAKETNVPRSTIAKYMDLIPELAALRESSNADLSQIEVVFDDYIKQKNINIRKQLKELHDGNFNLTDDEEGVLVNMAMLMATSGRGMTREELLELMNIIMQERIDKRIYVPATMKSVRSLIKRNKQLRERLRSAGSIDPARAAQATEETRDSMFTKLNNYIILMHELGICKEKNYCDIDSKQIYNMDECSVDTTRQKKKVLCSCEDSQRLFQNTPEGDGKMKIHISIALTSRADGKILI